MVLVYIVPTCIVIACMAMTCTVLAYIGKAITQILETQVLHGVTLFLGISFRLALHIFGDFRGMPTAYAEG